MPELREQLQTILGDAYRVQRELGGGGMSRVFVARDMALERDVVVKVLSPELAATVSVDRFRREILLAANLQHPHIIGVLGAGELDGLPYFTMPYVDGDSLRARLQRVHRLTVGETVSVLRDVARALAYAHERGVVHRDIKPDNILLSGGAAAVTDFGVAKAVAAARGSRDRPERAEGVKDLHSVSQERYDGTITLVGTSLGTPEYMAPEQAAADPNIDGRADIYALGITAYEMLTGSSPFRGRSPQQLLAAQLTEAPPSIASHRTDVPRALALLIARCLEKDPANRPQTAAELVAALSDPSVVSGAFISAAMPTVEREAWQIDHTRPRRRWIGVGVATLAVLAVVAVLVFRDRGAVTDASVTAAGVTPPVAGPPAPSKNSIAVLPFVNIGRDSADSYLADGITAELTAALGRLSGVQVASPTSIAALKGRPSSLAELGKSLRVALLVEGTLQREGTRLRVTARLVNAEDGFMLWSDVREHALTDVFTVQDEIARALADALGTELAASAPSTPDSQHPASRALDLERGTTNAAAYDAYLRGRHFFQKRGDASLREAIRYFNEAIAKDPRYALAYAGLADSYSLLPTYGAAPHAETVALALRAADRAVTLDSTRAEVWGSRGSAMLAAWRWNEAERAFRRAVALNPDYAQTRQWLGEVLLLNGRIDEGTAELRRAVDLEPLSPIVGAVYAYSLGLAGRHGEAIARARAAMALDSTIFVPRLILGALHVYARQPADAVRELRAALDFDPSLPQVRGLLGYAQAMMGDREGANATLATLVARESLAGHAGAIALVHLGLGDTPLALTWLERAMVRRDNMYATGSLAEPVFDPLRGTPRFVALVRRLGLEPRLAARR
jgi:eukaryotic-like serine/threonine-protein kinase